MTYEQLRILLNDMHGAKHTSMDKPVQVNVDGDIWSLDITESLTTGEVMLCPVIEDASDD